MFEKVNPKHPDKIADRRKRVLAEHTRGEGSCRSCKGNTGAARGADFA